MANAVHGKKTTVWMETTPGGGTKPPALAPVGFTKMIGSSVRQALSKDLASSDAFGQDEHTNEAGLRGGTVSVDIRFSQAQFAVMLNAYNTDSVVAFVVRPEGDISGKYQMWSNYHLESIDMSSSVGDVVNASVSLRRNEAINYTLIA